MSKKLKTVVSAILGTVALMVMAGEPSEPAGIGIFIWQIMAGIALLAILVWNGAPRRIRG